LSRIRDEVRKRKQSADETYHRQRNRLDRRLSNLGSKRKSRRIAAIVGGALSGIGLLAVTLSLVLPAITDVTSGDVADMVCIVGGGGGTGVLFLAIGGVVLFVGLKGLFSSSQSEEELERQMADARARHSSEMKQAELQLEQETAAIQEELETTLAYIDAELPKLRAQLEILRSQVPTPPDDEEIHQLLKDDVARLTEQASERSGLVARLLSLRNTENPLCILGPAELQERQRIPKLFTRYPDRKKHLKAQRFALMEDGKFEDFYGVYNLEFILIAEDMLGTYGCFFDFITGRVTGEHTSEQYYDDVVAISTRREFREVEIGDISVPVEDAPTFSMSLSSGERRQVTFASPSYFEGVRKQLGEDRLPEFDPDRWARNPEAAADNAIRALRARLRAHKGI
jgi:hypothetical protein